VPVAAETWERIVILAPALVIGAGLVGGVLILLGRAFVYTLRESGHPRLIGVAVAAFVAVIALLTYLGISLPARE
jgi:hypothetical protein